MQVYVSAISAVLICVDDVLCLMSRSAEPRLRSNVLERVRERKRMERRLLIAWSKQEQEAKE